MTALPVADTLTPKRRTIAWCIARGMTVAQIQEYTGLSKGSVQSHIVKIKDIFGVSTHVGITLVMLGVVQYSMSEEEPR